MKRIVCYLVTTFALTWILWGTAVSGSVVVGMPMASQLLIGLGMFCPALGVLVTWLMFRKKQPFHIPFRPHFRGNGKWYVVAWFMPALLTLTGSALYFLVFRSQLDPQMGYLRELGAAQGVSMSQAQMASSMALQIVAAVVVGPLLNVLAGAGEEVGWRGFLYPALQEKLSPAGVCLAGGVIWGLWHAPVTMRGHNYGLGYPGFPWAGVLMMCVFCIGLGTLLHWITQKSGSIWPAALAHGAVNAIAAAPQMLLPSAEAGNRLLGPAVSGLLGGLPLLLCAAVLLWRGRQKSSGSVQGKL
ncbi:CPBP family intramembrane glutamic endopeptidase [Agathobaculum sp.]|uniref:CPBP family intramembrane glutamic endopeptidase n=1 Tax=Agathobaculum sp. TaxID=2048138 RepID=UPI002A83B207|nr:type II CAAX endopeptidase family protein [Agathobaculum sp.]MDY3617423.1 type II CAAX endopeptidase family protein [Agathobaculum sp.]